MTSKNWETAGIDIEKVFTDMEAECEITGLQLRLILVNGLRAREASCSSPSRPIAVTRSTSREGTKGGRSRIVPIDNAAQRDILERCKVVAKGNSRGLVSPNPGKVVRGQPGRFYYLCEKVGITKKALGVTAHGLRHTYAARKYEQFTRDEVTRGRGWRSRPGNGPERSSGGI
jgi:integrase